jgi:hypothetical protein
MLTYFKRKPKTTNLRCKYSGVRGATVIHHYCPHTYNAGDHFVIRSIRKQLSRHLSGTLFLPKAAAANRGWGKPVRLKGENILVSNEYADAVVVGGSDMYNNWSLRIESKEIKTLQPPLYLIGMGISSKLQQHRPNIQKVSYYADILATHEHARLCAVRDYLTAKFLADVGYHEAVVTGCPALYLHDEKFHPHDSGVVALTFPFPVAGEGDPGLYQWLISLIKQMRDTAKSLGMNPVVVCHDDRDVFVAQREFPEDQVFFSNYVDEVIEFYRGVTMVVGSRLHASILAAGLGKPFININLDARGEGFTQMFGLSDWNICSNDGDLSSKLRTRMNYIASGKLDRFHEFYEVKSKYAQIFDAFMRSVAEDIEAQIS